MMLESYSTANISITQGVHAKVAQANLHVFCVQRKIRE